MFTLKIENTKGEIFELSHNTQNYAVVGVQGLTRPQTAINTAVGGGIDGAFFNSARVEMRNIVIDLILCGNIEANRQQLYNIFPAKTECTVYFQNQNRNVKIMGYVETLGGDLFVSQERMQISIICPRPFWQDLNTIYTELSRVLKMFSFPFSIAESPGVPFSDLLDYPLSIINNTGDVRCGIIIKISISGSFENLKIFNLTTQEYFGISYNLADGDQIEINTISGQMSVKLIRGGASANLLNYVDGGSSWMKLEPGENRFTFTAGDADAVNITFETGVLYGGI